MASLTDAEEALRSTDGKDYFLRLTRLLMGGGVPLLREKFDSFHSPADLPLKLVDPSIMAQLKEAKLSPPEWDCLKPSPGTFGKSTDFDITLTFRLLRTICNLKKPVTGWNSLPNDTDHSTEADLVRIKYYRNFVCHSAKREITHSEFCNLWQEISETLLRIAASISNAKRDEWKNAIDELLRDPLTTEAQRYVDELHLWCKKDMDVKDELEKVKEELQQVQRTNVYVGDQLQQNNQRLDELTTVIQLAVERLEGNHQSAPTESYTWTIILQISERLNQLLEYLKDQLGVGVVRYNVGSLLITVTCSTLEILERLWEDYSSGHLNKVAEQKLITPDVLEKLGLKELKLKTTITEEEYKKCKEFFLGVSQRYKNVPRTTGDKGIPLCLPNNFSWDPETGRVQKTSDDRHSLHPVPAAVKMLQEIKEPVCVVSVAGPCRDGKSYILGEVFGRMEVFPIGHVMDPETTGIWMWIVPETFKDSRGRNFRVILLDSEGTNAVTEGSQSDNQIFTLTVLLASVMIYNSKGVPKRNDSNDLTFIVKLSQRIGIQSKGGCDDQDLFRNTFPFFVWLLRDVSQKLPADCSDLNQFFSTRVFKEFTSANEEGRKVAESMLTYFSGFESFALPPPTYDDDIMQNISEHRDKLNPKFNEGVKRFEHLLKKRLVPKKSINQGEYVNGEALGALIQLYTDAINDPNAIPNVESAWETYTRTKCAKAKERAFNIYDQVMTQLISKRLPCENEEIQKNHETAQRKSMEAFEAETVELISTIIVQELRQLTKSIDEKVHLWRAKNASLTQKSCEDLLGRLKIEHLDPVLTRVRGPDGAKVSYADLMNGWSKIKADFDSKAVGAKDVRANVFFKFNQYLQEEVMKYEEILKKMKDYDENASKQKIVNAYAEKENRRLEKQLGEVTKREEERQRKMDMLEKRQQDELKLIKEQAKADKEALNKQMQMIRDADMKAQARLEKQLNSADEREKEANKALQDMQQKFEQSKDDAKADREAANVKFTQVEKESIKVQTQLQEQLSAISLREAQTNERLNSMMKIWEEDRRDAANMREEIIRLRGQINEANKPGFLRRMWDALFKK